MRKNLGWVVISAIPVGCGASCFYIQMRSKSEELEKMNDDLGKVVKIYEVPPKEKIKPGLIVAASVVDEHNVSFWTRAVTTGFTTSKQDVIDVRMNHIIYLLFT